MCVFLFLSSLQWNVTKDTQHFTPRPHPHNTHGCAHPLNVQKARSMAGENDTNDSDSTGGGGSSTIPTQQGDKGGEGGGQSEEGMSASCCDWPPQGYESSVLRVIKEEGGANGEGGGEGGGKGSMVVEEQVVLEYEGRRLTLKTLLVSPEEGGREGGALGDAF